MRLALLSVIAFLISLVIGETVLRVWLPQNLSGTWREADLHGLFVNKANWETEHQNGKRLIRYRFNSEHLRGKALEPGSYKVLFLGDSFTFGWLLEEQDTLTEQIQRDINQCLFQHDIQVLNGGAGGWGLASAVAFYELYDSTIEPEAVVFLINFDDLSRSLNSRVYVLGDVGVLKLSPNPNKFSIKKIINSIPGYQFLLRNAHILQLVRQSYIRFRYRKKFAELKGPKAAEDRSDDINGINGKKIKFGLALIQRAIDLSKERGQKIVFATTGFHALLKNENLEKKFLVVVGKLLKLKGVPWYDLTQTFGQDLKKDYASYTIVGDGHPNENGVAKMVRQLKLAGLYRAILPEGLLKTCPAIDQVSRGDPFG